MFEISVSSKGKIKKRINKKEDKIWKLIELREINFQFGAGDNIIVQVEGLIFNICNSTKNSTFIFIYNILDLEQI